MVTTASPLIYVPSSSEGLSFGKFDNKVGMQGDRNCMIFLDNVRVPKDYPGSGPWSRRSIDA